MQQFMIKLSELQALLQETPDANRILLTIDTLTNGKTKATTTIKVRVVNFLDGGQTDSPLSDARTAATAISLDAANTREIGVCPYPPGC
jgi:hypothetical protein